jgi:DNA-binding ferritin-like protein (Dps family)
VKPQKATFRGGTLGSNKENGRNGMELATLCERKYVLQYGRSKPMSEFFNNYFNLKKVIQSKREYRQQMARVKALPKEYQYVFKKIQAHMWMFASGPGYDMLKIHYDLIELFEAGAADGKHVLEITGKDVAAFCDELLRNAKTYTDHWRATLNRDILNALGKGKDPQ